ncbi:MAG: hypothetical protein E7370_05455 [Clostridiales bacterium]|nr:hypothetical protein [Clostridiales bacterium]
MKLAAIDIGSNSVRLLISANGKILFKGVNTTRLGEGLAKSGKLLPEAILRTANAVAQYFAKAQSENCQKIYAFATEAVRSAQNGQDFVDKVKQLCNLQVEVLSGEEEAKVGILGALGASDGGIIDIGGASTEIIIQNCNNLIYSKSVGVGVVRLYDLAKREPEALEQVILQKLQQFKGVPLLNKPFYAIGGTATTLASVKLGLPVYDAKKIDGTKLYAQNIKALADYFLTLSVNDVKDLPGMDPRRADVIGGGALLLYHAIKMLNIDFVTVSEKDNLEGFLILKEGCL